MKELLVNTYIVVKEANKGGDITIIITNDHITDCALLQIDATTHQTKSSDINNKHVTEAINFV